MSQLTVVIIDAQHLVRAGFSLILQAVDGVEVLDEGETVQDAVALANKHRPGLVLVAAALEAGSDFAATRGIRALAGEQPRILVMVGSRDGEVADAALAAGADGAIGKYATPEEIVDVIRGIAA